MDVSELIEELRKCEYAALGTDTIKKPKYAEVPGAEDFEVEDLLASAYPFNKNQ